MKTVVLTFCEINDELLDLANGASDTQFISFAKQVKSALNWEVREFPSNIMQEATQLVHQHLGTFPNTKTTKGKIYDLTTIDGTPLWYYHRVRVFFNVRQALAESILIDQYAEECSVHVYSNSNLTKSKYEHRGNVRVHLVGSMTSKGSKIERYKFIWKSFRYGGKQKKRLQQFLEKKHLVVVNNNHLSQWTKQKGKQNPMYGKILADGDSSQFGIVHMRPAPKAGDVVSFDKPDFGSDYLDMSSDYIVTRRYALKIGTRKSMKAEVESMTKSLSDVKSELEPIHQAILDEFNGLRFSSSVYLLQRTAYKTFFERSKAKTITSIAEQATGERMILDAAVENGIKSVGIQHGSIGAGSYAYLFNKDERELHPFPSLTLLWGTQDADYLIDNSCYRDEDIQVIGQLRTDYLASLMKDHNSKNEVFRLVFATQPIPDERWIHRAFESVLELAKALPTIEVEIRLHPAETETYYRSLTESLPDNVFFSDSSIDLYETILNANAVLTSYSTVGKEAVFIGKPLITFDPDSLDLSNYTTSGISLVTKNGQELITAVQDIMNDNFSPRANYDRYIRENAHQIDGRVAERYFNILEKL